MKIINLLGVVLVVVENVFLIKKVILEFIILSEKLMKVDLDCVSEMVI